MKKEKIYVPKKKKIIHNNQKECSVKEALITNDEVTIDDTINQLSNSNGYLFSKEVKIVTNNKEYITSIIRITKNALITIDNDIIKIKDIKNLVIM